MRRTWQKEKTARVERDGDVISRIDMDKITEVGGVVKSDDQTIILSTKRTREGIEQ
jgi:hypothetical protein